MMQIFVSWRSQFCSARGQTMTEYVLIMTAIAVAVFAGWTQMGQTLSNLLNSISTDL